jgi:hypothetical protein
MSIMPSIPKVTSPAPPHIPPPIGQQKGLAISSTPGKIQSKDADQVCTHGFLAGGEEKGLRRDLLAYELVETSKASPSDAKRMAASESADQRVGRRDDLHLLAPAAGRRRRPPNPTRR